MQLTVGWIARISIKYSPEMNEYCLLRIRRSSVTGRWTSGSPVTYFFPYNYQSSVRISYLAYSNCCSAICRRESHCSGLWFDFAGFCMLISQGDIGNIFQRCPAQRVHIGLARYRHTDVPETAHCTSKFVELTVYNTTSFWRFTYSCR